MIVLMALHHYYKGSDEGLAIADQWSRHDTKKYKSLKKLNINGNPLVKESNTGQM